MQTTCFASYSAPKAAPLNVPENLNGMLSVVNNGMMPMYTGKQYGRSRGLCLFANAPPRAQIRPSIATAADAAGDARNAASQTHCTPSIRHVWQGIQTAQA